MARLIDYGIIAGDVFGNWIVVSDRHARTLYRKGVQLADIANRHAGTNSRNKKG